MNLQCNLSSQCSNLITDISGLADPSDITAIIKDAPYWKQMYITEKVAVPAEKPDIESINSIDISVEIIRKDVIITPRSTTANLEGKSLSGRKLIIEGVLSQVIDYTALEIAQPVHTFHAYVPFSSYIVVPLEINFGTPEAPDTVDSLDINFEVNACIEDLSASLCSAREVIKQVTLLLYAAPTRS